MMGTPEDPGLIPRMNDALFVNMARKLDSMKSSEEGGDIKVCVYIGKFFMRHDDDLIFKRLL